MKIRDLVESLATCDPECEVLATILSATQLQEIFLAAMRKESYTSKSEGHQIGIVAKVAENVLMIYALPNPDLKTS